MTMRGTSGDASRAVVVAVAVCVLVALTAPAAPAWGSDGTKHASSPPRARANRPRLQVAKTKVATVPEIDPDHLLAKASGRTADLATPARRAGASLQRTFPGTPWTVLSTPHGSARAVQRRLAHDPAFSRVDLSYKRRAALTPNDALWPVQSEYLASLRVERAWDHTRGAGVTIAVLDTGVALTHPDLAGRLVPGYNVLNPGAGPNDDFGHGTMVAGVAAASTNNGIGIAGIADQASIMPVKVLDGNGVGTDADFFTGIEWAIAHGAKVLNMSFGGTAPSDALTAAVNDALAHNVVVVAAAGNDGTEVKDYPGAIPGVIAVSATGDNGTLAYFSTYGAQVSVAAPGIEIESTVPTFIDPTGYTAESGTSFSSPIVAGTAALVRAAFPMLTAAQVADRIRATARDVGPAGPDKFYGYGVVDPLAAVGGALPAARPSFQVGSEEPNDTPATARSLPSSPASATIGYEGDVDWFSHTFTTSVVPTWYRITVDPPLPAVPSDPRGMDAVIEVYDANGHFMAEGDSTGTDESDDLVVPITASGTYLLRISNFNGSPSPGAYQVTIATTAPRPMFDPYADVAIGAQVGSVAIGDVTGDGRNDLVAATSGAGDPFVTNKLIVFRQTPFRGLAFSQLLDADPGPARALAIGDLDNDTKFDVALATNTGIEIFHQSGGELGSPTTIGFGGPINQLVVTDLDGDAKSDIVVANTSGIWVLHNTGAGFTSSSLSGAATSFVTVGDVTDDGRKDVVGPGLTVYAQNPDGTFTPSSYAAGPVNDVATGELTGDGLNDVAYTNGASPGLVIVLPQLLAHTLGPALPAISVGAVPQPIAITDVDNDGRADIVVAHSGGAVGVVRQTSPGVLGAEQLFSARAATGLAPSQLAVGDLDSDNFADIVVGYSDGFSFLHQNGSRLPTLDRAWAQDVQPANVTFGNPSSTTPRITFGPTVDGATVTTTTVRLVDKTGTAVTATVNLDAPTNTVTITPNAPLPDGPYVVRIDGVLDANHRESLDAFEWHFTVGPKPDVTPPQTTITAAPLPNTTVTHPSISFTANEGGSTFECSLDTGAYHLCASPFTTTVGVGAHSLRVFARDAAGNEDATPAAVSWHVWPVPHGYWMVGRDGNVYPFGTVSNFGRAPTSTAVDIEAATTGLGYWIVDAAGRVFATGDAKWFGNASGLGAGETVTSLSRTATGLGYWLFTTRGRVLPLGDAKFFGDMHNVRLNGPVLDSVSTTTGHGYYMVGSDGGVFAFGDAKFYGSTGAMHLNSPVRSLVPDADGVGYWLVAADGGVFAFKAPFRGSMGGSHLNQPIVGMARFGNGYLMVASDGGVFDFSNKPFYGSLGGHPPAAPIVSIASRD